MVLAGDVLSPLSLRLSWHVKREHPWWIRGDIFIHCTFIHYYYSGSVAGGRDSTLEEAVDVDVHG